MECIKGSCQGIQQMRINHKSLITHQSANDEVFQLLEIYPHQVELSRTSVARIRVHGGETEVVIYLMQSEPKELRELLKMRHRPLPDWFCSRVTKSVISSALREV